MHPCFILIDDAVPAANPRRSELIIQRNCGVASIVKNRFKIVLKKSKPVFNACVLTASTNGFIKRIVGASGTKLNPVVLPKTSDRRVVKNDLRNRRKLNFLERLSRTLCCRIKAACPVQRITE